MKKAITVISVLLAFLNVGIAQNSGRLDSLRHELSIAKNDTSRMQLLLRISESHRANRRDSSIFYASKALTLARRFNMHQAELEALGTITLCQIFLGNDSRALQVNLEAISIAEKNSLLAKNPFLFIYSGLIYNGSNDHVKALNSFRAAKAIANSTNNILPSIIAPSNMAVTFLNMNELDSALYYGQLALDVAQRFNISKTLPLYTLGKIYFEKGDNELALKYFHESLRSSTKSNETFSRHYMISQVYRQMGIPDSSIFYAKKALNISLESNLYSSIAEANILLSDIYEKSEPGKALQYSKSALAYRDTLDIYRKNVTMEAFFNFDEQERQHEVEKATAAYQNKVQRLWIFSISGALISAIVLTIVLYTNIRNKKRANSQLKEQKEEIQSTLEKLESTQSQLIQSEKMASLGELTAGIAHEIQNPLNFVNNFSEVNAELVEELSVEVDKGNLEEVKAIAKDIRENEDKIKHHGQRAEGIVKGMLQHSRSSQGEKELTDINALADEYLRLAYFGMRAKNKSFNAEFKTEFDPNLPKINVIPQDIGRVLLNLINNAFYAVDRKAKEYTPQPPKGGAESTPNKHKPEVVVSTNLSPSGGGKGEDIVEISVKDNGPGIPDDIKDKIFQPFFTTKPTGSGTGLGLSLSYDIVKAHGGDIKVQSAKGKGSEFTVSLPINSP